VVLNMQDENQLVNHLEDAEKTNLKLREEIFNLRRDYNKIESLLKLSQEKETVFRSEIQSLQSTKLVIETENKRVLEEISQQTEWKEKCLRMERQVNELQMENDRLNFEKQNLESKTSNLERKMNEKNFKSEQPYPAGITVKTIYHNDVRAWAPQTKNCYKELLEFIEQQYDSTYVITYRDPDGDSMRITCDEDCRRAFDVAKQHGWSNVKLLIELRVEMEMRKEIVTLEMRNKKYKKQIQKLKKTTHGIKKGQVLLDAIMMNRKKESDAFA